MAKVSPRYNFMLNPTAVDPHPERVNAMTAEERAAEFFEGSYEPTIGVQGLSLPCPVKITLGSTKHGQLAVTALHIDAAKHQTAITATGLRQVGNMITTLLRRIAAPEAYEEDESYFLLAPLLERLAASCGGVAVRPGRPGYTPAEYRAWALEHREAVVADSDHPYTLLACKWHCSESQARRRVQRARELLPELFAEKEKI